MSRATNYFSTFGLKFILGFILFYFWIDKISFFLVFLIITIMFRVNLEL